MTTTDTIGPYTFGTITRVYLQAHDYEVFEAVNDDDDFERVTYVVRRSTGRTSYAFGSLGTALAYLGAVLDGIGSTQAATVASMVEAFGKVRGSS